MRFIFLFTLLLLVGSSTQGQNETRLAGGQFDHSYTGDAYYSGLGMNLEMMLGDRFSLNYSFLYGPTGSDEYYLYTGGGQAAAFYLIRKAITQRNGLNIATTLGIIAFILPESYSFRIPIGKKSQLAFFLAPYGLEFIKNRATDEEDYNISYEVGCRYYLAANKWMYIVPQVGMKKIYGDDGLGASFGMSVMFKSKKNKPPDE